MKAEFTKEGYIEITPENLAEAFAIQNLIKRANATPTPEGGFPPTPPVLIHCEVPEN